MVVGFESAEDVHISCIAYRVFAVPLVIVDFGIKHTGAVPPVVGHGTVIAHAEQSDPVFSSFIDIVAHITDGMSAVFAMRMKIHFVLRKKIHLLLRMIR